MLWTIDKIKKNLDSHGVVYFNVQNTFRCYWFSDNSYDVLKLQDDVLLCNNEKCSLMALLGY